MNFVMRKIVLVLFTLLFIPSFICAEVSKKGGGALLEEMKNQIGKLGTCEIVFEFEAYSSGGELLGEQSGIFIAQGDCFKISTPIVELFCDGESKWIYDIEAVEMTIFPHNKELDDIAENPFGVLKNLDLSHYKFSNRAEKVVVGSNNCYQLTLTPKDKDSNYTSLIIAISETTSLPVSLRYLNRNGDWYFLTISSIGEIPQKSSDYFLPGDDVLSNPDLYITDLRED